MLVGFLLLSRKVNARLLKFNKCWTSLGNKAALPCQGHIKWQLTSGPAAVVGANWPTL